MQLIADGVIRPSRTRSSSRCRSSRTAPRLALLAAAALALGVLGPASARTHAASKYGGTLVVGLSGGDPDSLDPTVSRAAPALAIYQAICQRLYDYDAKLQLVPVLAAALPVLSKDKLSYTIQLRQGSPVQRRHAVQRAGGRHHGPALHDLPRLVRAPATTRASTASPRPGRTPSSST